MGSLRKRSAVMDAVVMKMLEEGKVLSRHEYDNCKNLQIKSGLILNYFGSWSRMLEIIQHSMPEAWAEIEKKSEPPAPVKPIKPIKPVVKPVVKPTVPVDEAAIAEIETKDEQSI